MVAAFSPKAFQKTAFQSVTRQNVTGSVNAATKSLDKLTAIARMAAVSAAQQKGKGAVSVVVSIAARAASAVKARATSPGVIALFARGASAVKAAALAVVKSPLAGRSVAIAAGRVVPSGAAPLLARTSGATSMRPGAAFGAALRATGAAMVRSSLTLRLITSILGRAATTVSVRLAKTGNIVLVGAMSMASKAMSRAVGTLPVSGRVTVAPSSRSNGRFVAGLQAVVATAARLSGFVTAPFAQFLTGSMRLLTSGSVFVPYEIVAERTLRFARRLVLKYR